MRKIIADLLTESNNATYSLPRVGTALGLITLLAAGASVIWHGAVTDQFYLAFGGGVAALIGGGAAGARFTPEAPAEAPAGGGQ